jgi:ABC-type microcin C transport system permease subunit YejB
MIIEPKYLKSPQKTHWSSFIKLFFCGSLQIDQNFAVQGMSIADLFNIHAECSRHLVNYGDTFVFVTYKQIMCVQILAIL